MNTKAAIRLILIACLVVFAHAAEPPGQIVLLWPNEQAPQFRVSFGPFQQGSVLGGGMGYVSEALVQNLTSKPVARASFTVYLYDKDHVRVGEGILQANDLDPGQQIRVPFSAKAAGLPKTLSLKARIDATGAPAAIKTVAVRVLSKPDGANIKIDGEDEGVTPKAINVAVGTHTLELSKEGYAVTSAPLDVNADETSGGSITIELGGLSVDTIVLRDGTAIMGDRGRGYADASRCSRQRYQADY